MDTGGGIAEAKLHGGRKGKGCVLDLIPITMLETIKRYVDLKLKERIEKEKKHMKQ